MAELDETPEQWLSLHGSALYSYAMTRLRDSHKAEEAVQETLVAALTAQARYAGGASVRTWLIGILKHKILDQFRREARETPLEDPEEVLEDMDHQIAAQFKPNGHWLNRLADWGNPESTLEASQFREVLQRCMDGLPDRLARLFLLREVLEEDTDTICQELDITPTNLWTMLYRARMGLRKCLERDWLAMARSA